MKKRINLLLAGILLGGIVAALPTIGKIIVFTAVGLLLFFKYDDFAYNHDYKQTVGGAE